MRSVVDSTAHSALYFGETRDSWWHLDQLRLSLARFGLGAGVANAADAADADAAADAAADGRGALEVLDVGCGVGHWGRLVAWALARPLRVVGVDREPEWVSEADVRTRALLEGGELAGTWRYQLGDALRLPFPDASFDLVTCQTVLIHLADPRAALVEWRRVLRPGGWLVAAEPNNLANHAAGLVDSTAIDVEVALRQLHFEARCERGKAALGLGFNSLGELLPGLLVDAGLEFVGAVICDRVSPLVPPHASREAQAQLAELERFAAGDVCGWPHAEARRYFEAGGGANFEGEWTFMRARQAAQLAAVRAGHRVVTGGGLHYLHAARRPA